MPEASSTIGVLLVNVGTPSAPTSRATRAFLREFLGDPRVLDISAAARFLLLNAIILPFRPRRSAKAYRSIWMDGGSPLLVHGRAFTGALGRELGAGFAPRLAMRYGSPSIAEALDGFRAEGIDRIVVFPLYPQHAAATTGTSLDAAYRLAAARWNVPSLRAVPAFYDDPGFLQAFAEVARPEIDAIGADRVLFSFHGLPERQVRKADESGAQCLRSVDCCGAIGPANASCYRAQCFATAREIASRLRLDSAGWTVSFQSRLGRDPWIGPATDATVRELARSSVRRLVVICPAFVADCLETREEIGLRAKDDFLAHGGAEFRLVPSLNSHPAWVAAAAGLVRRVSGR
jgi:ferrochelatase